MEEIILQALPQSSAEEVQAVAHQLEEIGVTDKDDLQFVQESDLIGILKPIKIRRLLKMWELQRQQDSGSSVIVSVPFVSAECPAILPDTSVSATVVQNPTSPQFCVSGAVVQNATPPQFSAEDFVIPWNKFPHEIIESCKKGERPQKKYLLQMVRILVSEISHTKVLPCRANLRAIASEIVRAYPATFQDQCGDCIVANGYMSLMKRLENCVDNSKRCKEFCVANTDNTPAPKKIKKSMKDSYGCINWQPSTLPQNETVESQEEKKYWLINEFRKRDRDEIMVKSFMDITYASQRYLINHSKPSAANIKKEWPFLFEPKFLFNHCNELLGFNIETRISESMHIKGKKVYLFFKTGMEQNHLNSVVKELEAAKITLGNNLPEVYGSIPLVMAYFEEEVKDLIRLNMEIITEAEIEEQESPYTPYIATSGGNVYTALNFAVVFEKKVLGFVNNFATAVSLLFGCYYAFNVKYPESCAATMEFVQRCFADLHPPRGTKSERQNVKGYNCHPKVLQFVNKLRDFESIWKY